MQVTRCKAAPTWLARFCFVGRPLSVRITGRTDALHARIGNHSRSQCKPGAREVFVIVTGVVAVLGREHEDVPPTRGMFKGVVASELRVGGGALSPRLPTRCRSGARALKNATGIHCGASGGPRGIPSNTAGSAKSSSGAVKDSPAPPPPKHTQLRRKRRPCRSFADLRLNHSGQPCLIPRLESSASERWEPELLAG